MWRWIFLLVLAPALFCSCGSEPKKTESNLLPALSRHSAIFNSTVETLLKNYNGLTEAFVTWDTAVIDKQALNLKADLDSLRNLYRDSADAQKEKEFLSKAEKNLALMMNEADITSKRIQFNSISKDLFNFLDNVSYDNSKIYLQLCPMAFNDTDSGHWISKTSEIRNPYLGLHHPRYKSGMLECGETLDSISFKR